MASFISRLQFVEIVFFIWQLDTYAFFIPRSVACFNIKTFSRIGDSHVKQGRLEIILYSYTVFRRLYIETVRKAALIILM